MWERWPEVKRAELEGLAVAYALLIMRDWPVADMNQSVLAEHGKNALLRVKKRAWQHVRANAAQATKPTEPHGPDAKNVSTPQNPGDPE